MNASNGWTDTPLSGEVHGFSEGNEWLDPFEIEIRIDASTLAMLVVSTLVSSGGSPHYASHPPGEGFPRTQCLIGRAEQTI